MKPRQPVALTPEELFRNRLDNQIDMDHELVQLAERIHWARFDAEFGCLYSELRGRTAIPTRTMVGLHYLKHAFGVSDEVAVRTWMENPYWQSFCGETYFQKRFPMHPSSMTRWRKRLGPERLEALLHETVQQALAVGAMRAGDVERVTVDTTVQEKAIAHPTDSALLDRCRAQVVRLLHENGQAVRQSYARVGKRLAAQVGRYAHAKQFRRMQRGIQTLRTWLGRVTRELERKLPNLATEVQDHARELLGKAQRLLAQRRDSKKKLYSLHAPEVECICKGKARRPYEFGVKVSVAVSNRSNVVLGTQAMPGNPYDGHTLAAALEQVRRMTGRMPSRVYVDAGYKGAVVQEGVTVWRSRQRRPKPQGQVWRELKRRSAVEPIIGHMKSDGHLGRNYLKGPVGDAVNAILSGAGHNLRVLLKHLRENGALLCLFLIGLFSTRESNTNRARLCSCAA